MVVWTKTSYIATKQCKKISKGSTRKYFLREIFMKHKYYDDFSFVVFESIKPFNCADTV